MILSYHDCFVDEKNKWFKKKEKALYEGVFYVHNITQHISK